MDGRQRQYEEPFLLLVDVKLICHNTGTKLRTHLRYLIRRLLWPRNGPERSKGEVEPLLNRRSSISYRCSTRLHTRLVFLLSFDRMGWGGV